MNNQDSLWLTNHAGQVNKQSQLLNISKTVGMVTAKQTSWGRTSPMGVSASFKLNHKDQLSLFDYWTKCYSNWLDTHKSEKTPTKPTQTTWNKLQNMQPKVFSSVRFREGVINIQGGVYHFGALRALDADPPHFWPIPSRPPKKSVA